MFHRFNIECCTLFFSVWHSDVFPFSFWLVVHRFLLLLWTVNLSLSLSLSLSLCWCFVLLWRIRCVFLAESSVILRGWLKALCSVSADSESVGQHTSASPREVTELSTDWYSFTSAPQWLIQASCWSSTYRTTDSSSCVHWFYNWAFSMFNECWKMCLVNNLMLSERILRKLQMTKTFFQPLRNSHMSLLPHKMNYLASFQV